MRKIIVITRPEDFRLDIPEVEVVTAKSYLTEERYVDMRDARVFNLCRSYRYQTAGYYVSLLAEARGNKVIPSITSIQDFKSQTIIKSISDEIDHLIQKDLSRLASNEFALSIYFGKNLSPRYDSLCRALNNLFEAPMLRAIFTRNKRWTLQSIGPISLTDVPNSHMPYVEEFAKSYFAGRKLYVARKTPLRYDCAVLVDDKEMAPPSDERALKRFTRAAEQQDIITTFITKDDFSELIEYDALFIRATTAVNNFTYRFARKAAAEGLVVIDDPLSIVRCSNKVYLAELLHRARIPAPKTLVVHKDNIDRIADTLGFPCVLKQPDSAFSAGVIRVENRNELLAALEKFFSKSDFVIGQEYMRTDFDWRIGIIDRTPLFACKYFMARGHWQIYNWNAKGTSQAGKWETVPIDEAPQEAVRIACKAANLIGDGFYGVDVKLEKGKFYVIEVNDNPSVEAGVEDGVLKDALYDRVMSVFRDRIQSSHQRMAGNG